MSRFLFLALFALALFALVPSSHSQKVKMSINPDPSGDPSKAMPIDEENMSAEQAAMMANLQNNLQDIDFSTLGDDHGDLQEMIMNSLKGNAKVNNQAKNVKRPSSKVKLTASELAQYDGSDDSKPIYVSLRKKIYDVTDSAMYYKQGQQYDYLSGKEIARGLATGCLESTGLTFDTRGLSADQKNVIKGWIDFFKGKYAVAGELVAEQIFDSDPKPNDNCPEASKYVGLPKH